MQAVFIEGLKINTVIGVYEWERAIRQLLVIDIEMSYDMNNAIASDDVDDAINYKEVCELVESICHNTKAKLLEHLAGVIMDKLFETYPCTKIKLSIKKPNAITNAVVGVKLIKERDSQVL